MRRLVAAVLVALSLAPRVSAQERPRALFPWLQLFQLGPAASSYREDAAHVSGQFGTFVLAVRNDAGGSLCNATGDYCPFQLDSTGQVRVVAAQAGAPWSVSGSGTFTVAGTVTQGNAGSHAQRWMIGLSDGSGFISPATDRTTAAAPFSVRLSDGAAFLSVATDRTTAGGPFSLRLSDGAAFYDATKTGQLPSALVGGRLDTNLGAWLGSTAPTVGQKTKANSLPVVQPSDRDLSTAVSITTSGANCSPSTSCADQALNATAACTLLITSVGGGATLQFEQSNDTSNYSASGLLNLGTGVVQSSTTATGTWVGAYGGMANFRVRASALTSGTVTGNIRCSEAPGALQILGGLITAKIWDGTTITGVVAGTSALKTDMTSVSGTATVTAAAGVQKVGIVGSTGTSFETTAGVLDSNLKNIGNTAVSTGEGPSGAGVQRVILAQQASYSAVSTRTATAAGTGVFFNICGSGTKTIRLQYLAFDIQVATTAINSEVVLTKTSAATSAGTATTLTNVPSDSNDAAATAVTKYYTALGTAGTAVGKVDLGSGLFPVTASPRITATVPVAFDYRTRAESETFVLRGTAQCIEAAFAVTTTNAPTMSVVVRWTEE